MGRKPKPTALKLIAGNPGHRPLNRNEPKLTAGIGEPPSWLDVAAKKEWRRVVPDLEEAGVTMRVEAVALACYCQSVSRLLVAEEIIAREGIIAIGARGVMKHPATVVARESMQLIAKFASEFGLTPASRPGIKAKKPEKKNEFAEI